MDLDYQFRWQQFAHRLVDDLIQHPSANLPGMRKLETQYKVSRSTIEHALGHLAGLGIVTPAQHGKMRKVNLSRLHKISSLRGQANKRILFLSECPASNPAYMTRSLYESFHKLCDQEGFSLSFFEVPSEPSELHALLSAIQPCGAILYSVPTAISKSVFALDIPAIRIGGSPFHQTPYFVTSYSGLLIQAFEQGWKAGHRGISAPLWNKSPELHEKLAAQLENHFSRGGRSFTKRYHLPSFPGESPEEYLAALRELFRYTPPTCIILHNLDDYLMASSFFLREGLRIPDDISIILLSGEPSIEKVVPSIARFILFNSGMTLQAFRVLQEQMNGFLSHEHVELSPIWVPGDSLAAPKTR